METYQITRKGTCPVCNGALIHIQPHFNCNDCLAVFKFVRQNKYGGEDDVIVRHLNPKKETIE